MIVQLDCNELNFNHYTDIMTNHSHSSQIVQTSEDMAHVVTNEYIRNMRKDGTWAGEPEIIASHQKYSVNIQIITSAEVSTLSGFYMHNYKEDGAKETLYLGHIHESHYVSLGR